MRLCFQSSELCALPQLRDKALLIHGEGEGRLKILSYALASLCFTLMSRALASAIHWGCNYKTTLCGSSLPGTLGPQPHLVILTPFFRTPFLSAQNATLQLDKGHVEQTKVCLAAWQTYVLKFQNLEKWVENGISKSAFGRHAHCSSIWKSVEEQTSSEVRMR